jgi:hypothetical protein
LIQRDGCLDVDAQATCGDALEQSGDLVAGGRRHDQDGGDVLAAELVFVGGEGAGDGRARAERRAEVCRFAGGVQGLVDAFRCDGLTWAARSPVKSTTWCAPSSVT